MFHNSWRFLIIIFHLFRRVNVPSYFNRHSPVHYCFCRPWTRKQWLSKEALHGWTVCPPCRVLASGVVTENRAYTFSLRHDKAREKMETKCLTVSLLNPVLETSRCSLMVPPIHRDQKVTDAEDETFTPNHIFTSHSCYWRQSPGSPFVPTLISMDLLLLIQGLSV